MQYKWSKKFNNTSTEGKLHMAYLVSMSSTVLYPVKEDISEAVLRDTREPMIIILINWAGKRWIEIDIVLVESGTQTITNTFILQPRFKFCRSDSVIHNTLKHLKNTAIFIYRQHTYLEHFSKEETQVQQQQEGTQQSVYLHDATCWYQQTPGAPNFNLQP